MRTKLYAFAKPMFFAFLLIFAFSNNLFAQQFLTKIDGWNAYVHLPAEYADSTSKRYPVIIFIPGIGEVGTDPNKLMLNGPARFIAAGNPFVFNVNGKIEKPIVISIQPIDPWAPGPGTVNIKVDSIIKRWRCDLQRINGTGLSMGGQTWQNYVNTGNPVLTEKLASILVMSAPPPDAGISGMKNFATAGGKWWGFEGTQDYRQMSQVRDTMNNYVYASARYYQYIGGHCCWNTWYDPSWNENGESVYTWLLKQRRPALSNLTPQADAGRDTTTQSVVTTIALAGKGNDPDGNPITFAWRKIVGPTNVTIANTALPTTTAAGLGQGLFKFELAVTDVFGAISKDTVTIQDGITILPVKLLSFTGVEKEGKVLLNWNTTAEENSSRFDVEGSADGQQFYKAGSTLAKGGNSSQYAFTDALAKKGINYYRLKMIDKDGTFDYSKIISVNVKNAAASVVDIVTANAQNSKVNMVINSKTSQPVHIVLSDVQGRILYRSNAILNPGLNDISKSVNLVKGVYYIRLAAGEQMLNKAIVSQ